MLVPIFSSLALQLMLLGRYFSTNKYMFFFVFVKGRIREREEEEARRCDIETEFLSTSKTARCLSVEPVVTDCGTSQHTECALRYARYV